MPRDLFAEAGINPSAPGSQLNALVGAQANGPRDLFAEAGINPPSATPQEGMPSMAPSFLAGAAAPLNGLAQLMGRASEAVTPSDTALGRYFTSERQKADAIAEATKNYGNTSISAGGGFDPAYFAGNLLGSAPLMFGGSAPTLLGRLAAGAGSGALSGVAQPTPANQSASDFWSQKAKDATFGGIGGTVAPLLTGAAARIISPEPSANVQELLDAGVRLTPGQRLGGAFQRIEDASTSIPLAGDVVKSAQKRAVEDMNRAAINAPLSLIGEKSTAPLGNEAINEAAQKIGKVFDNTIPSLTAKIDPTFEKNVAELTDMATQMAPQTAQQFASIFKTEVARKISPAGVITGDSAHEMQSTLGRLAALAHKSPDMNQQLLGDALQQTQSNILDLISRSNPVGAEDFNAARAAYKAFIPVQKAAGTLGANQGVFTGAQLLGGVRAADRSLDHRAFARGLATGQDFAGAAKDVLGQKVPDSGTPLRGIAAAAAMLGPMSYYNLPAAVGAATGGLGLAGAYSPPMQWLLRHALTTRPAGAEGVAQGLRLLSPAASVSAPLLMGTPQ